jgi:hypothetical protein
MKNYRSRPKGNYIQDANWKDLYILAENWKLDIEFYLIELEFFERLLETYFTRLLLHKNLDELQELHNDLIEAKWQCKDILQRIISHLNHIVNILDEPFTYDAIVFRNSHEQLEDYISEFTEMLKAAKYNIVQLTKAVLVSETPKFIWKYN